MRLHVQRGDRAAALAAFERCEAVLRAELGVSAQQMPLASVLEGGTWAAGRRVAVTKREGGGPPLNILSDGTVF